MLCCVWFQCWETDMRALWLSWWCAPSDRRQKLTPQWAEEQGRGYSLLLWSSNILNLCICMDIHVMLMKCVLLCLLRFSLLKKRKLRSMIRTNWLSTSSLHCPCCCQRCVFPCERSINSDHILVHWPLPYHALYGLMHFHPWLSLCQTFK